LKGLFERALKCPIASLMLDLLKNRVLKERLKELCREKYLPVSGSKDELIERIIGHYDYLIFSTRSINILDILSWDELLYISINGESAERKYLLIQT